MDKLKSTFTYSLAAIFLIVMWHLASILVAKPFLPPPLNAFRDFFRLFMNWQLTGHFAISTYRVIISILIAFIFAVPLGIFLGRHKTFDNLLAPLIYILYPLPKIVFLPILVVFLGLGNAPKIVLITIAVFFQLLVTVRDSARAVPYQSLQVMRSLNASNWQIYRHLIWPYCLPSVLTSLRIALGTAVAILFLAETFASKNGLGYFILDAMEKRDYGEMYAGIIAMGLLGLLLYEIVDLLQKRYIKWQK
ncbi:MAG: ABC transporter permease [Peptococcales bacterium]|jgi:ABC-type nitrate/sulfonate/bicarbonate transport system permease component